MIDRRKGTWDRRNPSRPERRVDAKTRAAFTRIRGRFDLQDCNKPHIFDEGIRAGLRYRGEKP